jgi:aminopeptidase N
VLLPAAAAAAAAPQEPTTARPLQWIMHNRCKTLSTCSQVDQSSRASAAAAAGAYEGRTVAVKIFIADVSPDGSTAEEMAINCAVRHPNLTRVLALVVDTQQQQQDETAAAAAADNAAIVGLVLELVHGKPLADRPTSEHLLRCK